MSTRILGPNPFQGLAGAEVLRTVLAREPDTCPFVRWHLRGKFRVMEGLFRKYLAPNTGFLDMACGSGDGLVLASLCQPRCELWGLDIDRASLEIARRRTPGANLVEGDMLHPGLPKGYFDLVHEFGAACMVRGWDALAKAYFSLLRDGGILLWELPQKWSTAHISYLFSVAPKITAADTKFKRVLRSFSPYKYSFESDKAASRALEATGCDYEVLERVPIWHFYCRGLLCRTLDLAWRFGGDGLFDWLDRVTGLIWPRYAGYYLVIRKVIAREPVHSPSDQRRVD